jgi:NADH-quinone oxidoreductase subunit F
MNLGKAPDLDGKRVAVVGGGNVASDAARSALRLGAKVVSLYYRRTKEEMPAMPEEIVEMEKEGIELNLLVAPVAITGADGRVKGLTLTKMELGAFDRSGRRRPEPLAGSEFTVAADVIIVAVGQMPETVVLGTGLKVGKGDMVLVDPETLATNIPSVFSGGDCVTGPDTLIAAIAAGKKAAQSIDKYLGGDGVVVEPRTIERKIIGAILEEETPRQQMPFRHVEGFHELELGYTLEQAVAEAARCVRCDVID